MIQKVTDIRRVAHLEEFCQRTYGGFHERIVLPHEVWMRLLAELPIRAQMPGNPPRLRCLLGEARYEVMLECAPEKDNRLIKGQLDLSRAPYS